MQGSNQKGGSTATLILLVGLGALVACHSTNSVTPRATSVGERLLDAGVSGRAAELSANRTFPDVVWIGPNLARKLDSLAAFQLDECSVGIQSGDHLKDHEASHHLVLSCDQSERLGIRLRFDKKLNKFHILGFWTPFETFQDIPRPRS